MRQVRPALLSGDQSVNQENMPSGTKPMLEKPNKGLPNVWLMIAWALAMTAVGFYVFVLSR
jgi:hypothetical protein